MSVDALRGVPAFDGLPEATLERLAAVATEVEVPAGQVLIEHDTPAAGLYVILEGRVAVHARDEDVELGAGEIVGEIALLRGGTRTARVSAITPVRCLSIAREHVDAELAEALGRAGSRSGES